MKVNDIYRCNVCGNVVESLYVGGGDLVCCGQKMEKLVEKTEDEGAEKHRPVIAVDGDKTIVKIGSVAHPMEEAHHIAWIEISKDGKIGRKDLKPGDKPEAEFFQRDIEWARCYCNIHGLWKSK